MEGRGDGGQDAPAGGAEVHWRERCLILEDSLNRFRQQASKIRNALGHKVGVLAGCPRQDKGAVL